ncbi:MAG TPA: GTP 3',8-cyclase MoaA [Dehalococcoidia bacterium]|nr:GTP 3',8-cyclase MoaA [Dehalococcoidia bacterium]
MSSSPDSALPDVEQPLLDRFQRPLRDLRISVTDRCNFRCQYCMPREVFGPNFEFLPRDEILSFEEIARLASVFASRGVRKFRLTGGEPLLRNDLSKLVEMLAAIDGIDLAVTTNASLLASQARALAHAGLDRVTVSLDSIDDEVFREMNDVDVPVSHVLEGIEAAERAGLGPVKVNCVVRKGVNDHTLVDLARHFKGTGHIVRFIEFMDVGTTNGWKLDEVASAAEVVEQINAALPLVPLEANYDGEVAKRWAYADGEGEIGLITSVTEPFCATCTRARISADGRLYTCLFAVDGLELREALRAGASDDELTEIVRGVWTAREDRYSELRSDAAADMPRVEMSFIGG